ncbi:thiamine phosphate synthase [Clostridium sp. KNHs205]|jgi:thiamine-phosphate pyrophosphorylase|uniref:thiamine phosphate synthase n=1 Tax=Clostridium sp. KNHs205 TaxID=1449050 RepID=UPI00051B5A96|nr:thiamine phosphate synthase [Clostridium sp. KNHs205]
MDRLRDKMLLYLVTDRTWLGEKQLAEQVEAAVRAGVTMVQLREKELSFDAFTAEALEVKKVTDSYRIPLIINDRIDVAAAVDAAGVHLGQKDGDITEARRILGKNKIIGMSAHNVREAAEAEEKGADYLGAGAVFGSSTKTDASLLTFETLKDICHEVTIPVTAIGGINSKNIFQLSGTGISSVAVISAILGSRDIMQAAAKMKRLAKQIIASS